VNEFLANWNAILLTQVLNIMETGFIFVQENNLLVYTQNIPWKMPKILIMSAYHNKQGAVD
jgi:hypothetical protein